MARSMAPFADRRDAGRRLAARLDGLRGRPLVVLGLPRGGVPVAAEVAAALDAPLDVVVVRKLGVPYQPELAMGAIGEGGVRVLEQDVLDASGTSERELATVERAERAELARRIRRYRGDRPARTLTGVTAVVVDDGIATGATARAACRIVRAQGAATVVLAVPVGPRGIEQALADAADEVVCAETPAWFGAIGQFYADFTQTSDAEVLDCLAQAADRAHGG